MCLFAIKIVYLALLITRETLRTLATQIKPIFRRIIYATKHTDSEIISKVLGLNIIHDTCPSAKRTTSAYNKTPASIISRNLSTLAYSFRPFTALRRIYTS